MNKKTIITILLALVAIAGQGQTIPQDWFKTDTITIRGRIEGFDAERFGFKDHGVGSSDHFSN